ncbi:MAG: MBL fold metallo-hydrolase [Deltaproteobacteria bacterium]|nr:MBL fold metallo-hydrolase [Deltaproteobacteria bacterium]MBK8237512.1 MBL fold metallo-hydrolase [Deltaproteobacteria bacterium]MBK8719895.1 MBL fold metallo-hydrolase [Deltaproteobacteria bacterium]MBP7290708.1 MBL fold metallo-hydrolase [Nannocystaceae bacterium]
MLLQQLFEPLSSTYTYLLADPIGGVAALVDPVLETVDRDLALLQSLGLRLTHTIETHVHADHLTSARKLRHLTGARVVAPALDALPCADIGVRDGETLQLGTIAIVPRFTPGHTDTHHAYVIAGGMVPCVLTGDALLIDGCGRTDFQGGDARTLYRSITQVLFALPPDTLVYPGHDYQGRRVSTIAQERDRNPRLAGKDEDAFVEIMAALQLPYPRKMPYAVPGNRMCGECPPDVPDELRSPCELGDQG